MRAYPSLDEHVDQLDLLLAATNIGLWELDLKTSLGHRNLRHDQIFGYTELVDDWQLDSFLGHVVEENRAHVKALVETAVRERQVWTCETKINRADGADGWISAKGVPKFSASGEMIKLVGHVIDITATKENEERLKILTNELDHRVKNSLALIQSIAKQTFPKSDENLDLFLGRMTAMTFAHDILFASAWQNADLRDIVEKTITLGQNGAIRVEQGSPVVSLRPNAAVAFSMALHELCTNALKYGALSAEGGTVTLGWSVSDVSGEFQLDWKEHGGPKPETAPSSGFGTTIITSALASEIQGDVDLDFAPAGVRVTVKTPLLNIQSNPKVGA